MSVYDEWAKEWAEDRAKFPEPLHLGTLATWPTPAQAEEMERLRFDWRGNAFLADDARLARMHGYRPVMAINLRPPRVPETPSGYLAALKRAWWRIRREVWTVREAALRGERWEGIG